MFAAATGRTTVILSVNWPGTTPVVVALRTVLALPVKARTSIRRRCRSKLSLPSSVTEKRVVGDHW